MNIIPTTALLFFLFTVLQIPMLVRTFSRGTSVKQAWWRLTLIILAVLSLGAVKIWGHVMSLRDPFWIGFFRFPWFWICGMIFQISGANVLPDLVLTKYGIFPKDIADAGSKERRRGQIIGALERLMIFFLVMVGQPMGIVFLVAAKWVALFKMMEKRSWAAYVLIGTLLSVLMALLSGFLIRRLGL